jgi:hypothetical protein
MVGRITFTLGLVMSLLFTQQALAIPVVPTDLDGVTLGAPAGTLSDEFDNLFSPPPTTGTNDSAVYLIGTDYYYVHTVTPSADNNFLFNTEFEIPGFTGVAGYSFAKADDAEVGIVIERMGDRLFWAPTGEFDWDSNEPISFFFVSTRPPGVREYNLMGLNGTGAVPISFSTADGLAPVPEPGSIALFGSGLVGLYAAMRRRRNLKL